MALVGAAVVVETALLYPTATPHGSQDLFQRLKGKYTRSELRSQSVHFSANSGPEQFVAVSVVRTRIQPHLSDAIDYVIKADAKREEQSLVTLSEDPLELLLKPDGGKAFEENIFFILGNVCQVEHRITGVVAQEHQSKVFGSGLSVKVPRL